MSAKIPRGQQHSRVSIDKARHLGGLGGMGGVGGVGGLSVGGLTNT